MARNKETYLKIPTSRKYPNPLASAKEKSSDEYGLKMAQLISYEWFYRESGSSGSNYFDKRLKFDKQRRYARGEHSTSLIEKLITDSTDGETFSNYDFRAIQIFPKFIKLIVNQMLERLYEIDAQAVDGISQGLRDQYRDILEKHIVARPMLEDAKNLLGVDMSPSNIEEMPESSEELALHMKLKYKPSIEIAIEEALKYTLELNEYDETQKKLLKDLVEIGVCALHHKTDPTKGIVIDYRDPADMVWSYPTHSNFKEVYYFGHIKRMTINELQRISGKKFNEDTLNSFQNVSNEYQTYNSISNERWVRSEDLNGWLVDVLFFTYKSTKTTKYKKKYKKNGSFSMTERSSDFVKDDKQLEKEKNQGYKDFDILEDMKDVWYEGSVVVGTEMIFNYQECSNMVRPEGYISNNVMSNYVMYAPELYQGRIQSLTDRVEQTIDQLQQIQIKIQQFIAKAKPNGIGIDIDGLQEMDLGGGNTFTPLDLIRYYDQTGNLLYTSRSADGTFNSGKTPIVELNNGIIAGLEQLLNAYNFHLNLFREAIGISQGADASLVDTKTSVGALQQGEQRSNLATRYLLEGQLKMTQYLANGLSLRLKDIFKYSNLKKAYINSIGKINVDILESLKSLHLHDFGITIKLKPDAQDKIMLEQNIQAEIAAGGLSTTDGIDIRKISNISSANEMLKIRKEKHLKNVQKREIEKITAQSEGNAKAAQAASQAKISEIDAANQGKTKLEILKGKNSMEIMREEARLKAGLMGLEHAYAVNENTAIEVAKEKLDNKKEDNKFKRQAESASQQSVIKAESKKEQPKALNFKSEHASLTGDVAFD